MKIPLVCGLGLTAIFAGCQSSSSLSGKPSSVQTEVALELKERLPTIPVQIHGRTYPLMLDLGDWRKLSLSPQIIKHVQPRFTGKTIPLYDAMGNLTEVSEFIIPRIALGSRVFTNVTGYEHTHHPRYPSPSLHGNLGRPFFAQEALLIDYPARRILLLDPEHNPYTRGPNCVSFESVDYGLVSRISTAKGEITAVWDTGAQYSVHKGAHNPDPIPETITIADQTYTVSFIRIPFQEPPVDAYLGNSFFLEHAVYINLKHRCFLVDPEIH